VHVLGRRELERGDRDVGQARWQWSRVHRHGAYDVEVDTDASSLTDCAAAVRAGLVRSGAAFEALRRTVTPGRPATVWIGEMVRRQG